MNGKGSFSEALTLNLNLNYENTIANVIDASVIIRFLV